MDMESDKSMNKTIVTEAHIMKKECDPAYAAMNNQHNDPPLEVLLSTANKSIGYGEYMEAEVPEPEPEDQSNGLYVNKSAKLLGLEYPDLEKFVGLVKEHPSLYDTSKPEYKDSQLLSTLWEGISNVMELSDMNGQAWKKKWRHLRDMYVRKKREIETGRNRNTALRAKKWQFLPLFTFLDPHIEYRSSNSSIANFKVDEDANPPGPVTSQRGRPLRGRKPGKKQPVAKSGQTDQLEKLLVNLVSSHKKSWENFETRLKDKLDSRTEDDNFFDSCSKRMKKLSSEKRSLLKLQITQLFFNAENPDLPDVPVTSLHANQPVYQPQFPHHHQHYHNT